MGDCIAAGTIPVVCLQTIYRQQQGNPIITNAEKIKNGELDLELNVPTFRRYHLGTDEENMQAACELYIRYGNKIGFENVVILSPYHKATNISTNVLNKRLQEMLNPFIGQSEISAFGRKYRARDRVMQLRNTDVLSNGDVGIITKVIPNATESEPCVIVKFESGYEAEYVRDNLVQLEHCWAMSVHKSQGSQYRAVIMVLPNKCSDFLRRNTLYTAITRAKEVVALIGATATIYHFINNNKKDNRFTNLTCKLQLEAG